MTINCLHMSENKFIRTMKMVIWNKNANITSVAFRSSDAVDAISSCKAFVKHTCITKLSTPTAAKPLHSLKLDGKICFVANSPSIITATVKVAKKPTQPNTDKTVDQCSSGIEKVYFRKIQYYQNENNYIFWLNTTFEDFSHLPFNALNAMKIFGYRKTDCAVNIVTAYIANSSLAYMSFWPPPNMNGGFAINRIPTMTNPMFKRFNILIGSFKNIRA